MPLSTIAIGLQAYLDAHSSTSSKPVRLEVAERDDGADKQAYFVIHAKGSEDYDAMDDGVGSGGLRAEVFDIVVYANTTLEAINLADAVASHLSTVSVPLAMGTDRVATDIQRESDIGDFDASEYGNERGLSIRGVSVWIQHKAAA